MKNLELSEKDIENLIVRYPKIFFPDRNFTLIGRQIKLGKKKRRKLDILFKDNDKRVLIEIKKGLLDREAIGQIIEYQVLFKKENPSVFLEAFLCVNEVSEDMKSYLEGIGIKCCKFSYAFLRKLVRAKKYTLEKDIIVEPVVKKFVPPTEKFEVTPFIKESNSKLKALMLCNDEQFLKHFSQFLEKYLNCDVTALQEADMDMITTQKFQIYLINIAYGNLRLSLPCILQAILYRNPDSIVLLCDPHNISYWSFNWEKKFNQFRIFSCMTENLLKHILTPMLEERMNFPWFMSHAFNNFID